MPACPPECHEQLTTLKEDVKTLFGMSIPVWARCTIITLIGGLFILYGSLWVYSASEFSTKTEVKEIKSELRSDIKDMNEKLDLLLMRTKP